MADARAWVVVDLGFGDAGKGAVVDALVARTGARVVARFNGGAQAGHNVVTPDGRHHTFSQLGAGTFHAGVTTLLGPDVVVHPLALGPEAAHLASVGVPDALDRLRIHRDCRVTTPWHQALNRARERARGAGRHGSCGVGFGETVRDALACPEAVLRMGDLHDPGRLRALLDAARDRLGTALRGLGAAPLAEPEVMARTVEGMLAVGERVALVDDDDVRGLLSGPVVCEGAQGVLLDEHHGFHPYTTWSTTTFDGADALLDRAEVAVRHRVGVLRTHGIRHGPGPFVTEDALDLPEPHNALDPWQGPVRVGGFDLVAATFAVAACGGIDGLWLTHADRYVPRRACTAYRLADGDVIRRIAPAPTWAAHGERTRTLLAARPCWSDVDGMGDLVARLGVPLVGVGRGPTRTQQVPVENLLGL